MVNVKAGDIVKMTAISWYEDWDFDFPSALIFPIQLSYENAFDCDQIFEDFMISLVCDFDVKSDEKRHFRMRSVAFLRVIIFLYHIGLRKVWPRLREIKTETFEVYTDKWGDLSFRECRLTEPQSVDKEDQ